MQDFSALFFSAALHRSHSFFHFAFTGKQGDRSMFRFSSANARSILTIRRTHLLSVLLVTLAAVVLFYHSSRQASAQSSNPFTTVSAASYSPNVSPGMIVAGFGSNVATS